MPSIECGPLATALMWALGTAVPALAYAVGKLWAAYKKAREEHLRDLQGAIAYTRTIGNGQ